MNYRSLSRLVLASTTLLGCAVAPLLAQELVFEFDPAQTRIDFTLADILHTVHGTFKLKRGVIRFDSATGSASGEVVVDVTSGASGNNTRDRKMHKDILESQKYPEATFVPHHVQGSVNPLGESQVDIQGTFTLHGAAHEISVTAQVQGKPDRLTASSRFVVPYFSWGIKNPSTFILRVSDRVDIDIHAAGNLRIPTAH